MTKPRPFVVDPETLARIRPLASRDVARVANMHAASMGDSLWAKLGPSFLAALYRALLTDPDFIGFVYEEGARVKGFIAGSSDSHGLFRRVLAKHWRELLIPAARGLYSSPGILRQLLMTPAYFTRSAPTGEKIEAESMFCSFEPHLRGKRISGHINKVLFDELYARGHTKVKITTETTNEAAIRQLTSWGFMDQGSFFFYGKKMRVYVLDLEKSERVDPIRRYTQSA